MPDDDDAPVASTSKLLKPRPRREQRACDNCRRRRRACDGSRVPLKPCSLCIENRVDCLFTGAAKKQNKYVEALEARLEANQVLLNAQDALAAVATESSSKRSQGPAPSQEQIARSLGSLVELTAVQIRASQDRPPSHPADIATIEREKDMRALPFSEQGTHFHQNASRWGLVAAAVQQRERFEGRKMEWRNRRAKFWESNQAPSKGLLSCPSGGPLIFPAPDVMDALLELYFRRTNIFYPVLHRPTFARNVAAGLHNRDREFGVVVLSVCAIGAQYSNDPPVRSPCHEEMDPGAGVEYLMQLPQGLFHLFATPTLYQLQFFALMAVFLHLSEPSRCWTFIALGMRVVQDRGAHCQGAMGRTPTPESEQWKRAFWVLGCLDRLAAMTLGQPTTLDVLDSDAEFPVECDDQYWPGEPDVGPGKEWVQPPGTPSYIAYFNRLITLVRLQSIAMRVLYSVQKTTALFSLRDDKWQEKLLKELDSALNVWAGATPSHLRWDTYSARERPEDRDDVFFEQAVVLNATYYGIQIYVHRQFLPGLLQRPPPSDSVPSHAICTNAARATSHILHEQHLRRKAAPMPYACGFAFTSALILVINLWGSGIPPHLNTTLEQIERLMEVLQTCETTWLGPGLYWDIIRELSALPETETGPRSSVVSTTSDSGRQKRPRSPPASSFRPNSSSHPAAPAVTVHASAGTNDAYVYALGPPNALPEHASEILETAASYSPPTSDWHPQAASSTSGSTCPETPWTAPSSGVFGPPATDTELWSVLLGRFDASSI